MNNCTCNEAGYSPEFKRKLNPREQQICKGENVDPSTRIKYLNKWKQESIRAALGHKPGDCACHNKVKKK